MLASSVGPEGAGVYSLGLAFVLLFQYGTELGLQGVVVRDIAQHQAREGELIPNLLYLRFMLGTLAYAVVAALVTLLEFSHEIVQAALIVGLQLFFDWYHPVVSSFLHLAGLGSGAVLALPFALRTFGRKRAVAGPPKL